MRSHPGVRLLAACFGVWMLAASAIVLQPVAPVRAATTGNIPGVPLPGPVVTGKLGGPIYDVVYSVDVPPAHVLLLSLTGTAGTDFDLYLFDASATNIYADPPVGQVASSTGPTSTESITCPTVAGGTFYIDVSGATNVEGTFRLAVQIAADTTPPRVSLSLDGGAPATNQATVAATVIATDDLSGVGDVQFSEDGSTWGAWQPYQPTVEWTFPPGDGPKTLWVRARDRAGNVSAAAHATIALITTPPLVLARDPGPSDPITSTLPTLRVTFSEPIRVASWTNFGLILQDAAGTVLYGTYGWDASTNTGTFTPATPLLPGAAYSVSLGSIVDLAGNPLAPIGSWVIRPMIMPAASMDVTPRVTVAGSIVTLSGRVSDAGGSLVVVQRSVSGGPWSPFVTLFPAPDGSFAARTTTETNASFRADVPATPISVEAVSEPVRVLVRRVVLLDGVDAGSVRRVAAGTRIVLTAVITPAEPAVPVTLSIYRYVPGRGYVRQTAVTRTTVNGRYVFSWHPARGTYYVRLTTAPTPLFANGISPAYRWVGY